MANRGKPKTPEIIEFFIQFLYVEKNFTYDEIRDLTGVSKATVGRIAQRLGFAGKSRKPQKLEDTLDVIDGSFRASVSAVNEFMTGALYVAEENVHQHVSTQKNLVEVRRGTIEASTFSGLKLAIEALKDVRTWVKTTELLTDEQKTTVMNAMTTYQEEKAQESIAFLKKAAK